jgi:hypothetical protein
MSLGVPVQIALGCVVLGVAAGCAGTGAGADALAAADGPVPTAADAASTPDAASTVDMVPAADSAASAPAAACQSDDDCQLVSDCCSCQAIPRGEKPATCDPKRSCVMSVCAQYRGVDRARCSAGRCVLGFECDPGQILCKRLPPVCPPGQVPQVVNACYGECVDARQCLTVASCAVCGPADVCVRAVAALGSLHCHAPLLLSREM